MANAAGIRANDAAGWWLSLPAVAGLGLFLAVPFATAVVFSFTNLHLGSPLPLEFVGLEQYRRIFHDPLFVHALRNNAVFAAVVVPVQTVLALGLALLVHHVQRGRWLLRGALFLPVIFPMALVAVIWILILAPGVHGMLNGFLHWLSFGGWQPRDFLHDPALAMPAIMLVSIWQGVGFQMVILLAGLQGIPASWYEAAALDGAGHWHRFMYVTLPGLRNPLIFVALITMILAFRLFDQVQIMTQGGPNGATTTVMVEAVQAAFARQQIALAAAMSVVLFVIVLIITVVQRRLARHRSWFE